MVDKAVICEAIQNKRCLSFVYDDYFREVEPHACGVHKESGRDFLRAYQTKGGSSSEKVPDWKIFYLDEISNIQMLSNFFIHPRPGYEKNDLHMIYPPYCQI